MSKNNPILKVTPFSICKLDYAAKPAVLTTKYNCYDSIDYCLLSIRQEAHVGAIVEENANGVIRQLVAEAVLIGVVHPFGDPLKTAAV